MSGQFPDLRHAWLGRMRYSEALTLQRSLFDRRKAGVAPDTLLLLEHEPVYTLGRRAKREDVLVDETVLRAIGAEVVETDRGGEVTYHGPGQLVMYPVISIREAELGPVTYVRILEQVVIDTLRQYGVEGHRVVGKTGVWVGGEPGLKPPTGEVPAGRKIAAMGVRVSGGVAMHGLALNVSTELAHFSHIVPCGMPLLPVTSIEKETGAAPEVDSIAGIAALRLAELLQRTLVRVDVSEIGG
ncbi:MAG: lipoyl(octanoyl) transferase LipB [Chloroflexi bacterium]|nr:lipoyl(octanoyl) transferase LipB [Chloroflexota bacterium]